MFSSPPLLNASDIVLLILMFTQLPEAVFLVAVLDVGTIFEVKFQRVRAQNMSF